MNTRVRDHRSLFRCLFLPSVVTYRYTRVLLFKLKQKTKVNVNRGKRKKDKKREGEEKRKTEVSQTFLTTRGSFKSTVSITNCVIDRVSFTTSLQTTLLN